MLVHRCWAMVTGPGSVILMRRSVWREGGELETSRRSTAWRRRIGPHHARNLWSLTARVSGLAGVVDVGPPSRPVREAVRVALAAHLGDVRRCRCRALHVRGRRTDTVAFVRADSSNGFGTRQSVPNRTRGGPPGSERVAVDQPVRLRLAADNGGGRRKGHRRGNRRWNVPVCRERWRGAA